MALPQLYARPEIYELLRAPEPRLAAAVDGLLVETLGTLPGSLLDPACGPGGWLLRYAANGMSVAGNDLSGEMVAAARERLAGHAAEIVQGDMLALAFETGPFDAAVEVSGVISELPDDQALVRLIRSVAGQLRLGGVFVLALSCVEESDDDLTFFESEEMEPRTLSDGSQASLLYHVVDHDPGSRSIHMRRVLSLNGAEAFEDRYVLRTYSARTVRALVAEVPEMQLVAVRHPVTYQPVDPGGDWHNGEVILALRKSAYCIQ